MSWQGWASSLSFAERKQESIRDSLGCIIVSDCSRLVLCIIDRIIGRGIEFLSKRTTNVIHHCVSLFEAGFMYQKSNNSTSYQKNKPKKRQTKSYPQKKILSPPFLAGRWKGKQTSQCLWPKVYQHSSGVTAAWQVQRLRDWVLDRSAGDGRAREPELPPLFYSFGTRIICIIWSWMMMHRGVMVREERK